MLLLMRWVGLKIRWVGLTKSRCRVLTSAEPFSTQGLASKEVRFSLEGLVIPRGAVIPSHLGLHHHGEEPEVSPAHATFSVPTSHLSISVHAYAISAHVRVTLSLRVT